KSETVRCSPGCNRTGDQTHRCVRCAGVGGLLSPPRLQQFRLPCRSTFLKGRLRCGGIASRETDLAGRVERGPQGVVERFRADLVTGRDRLSGADEACAGAALLGLDEWAKHALDRGAEFLDEWMRLVQAASVHAHDNLRAGRIKRFLLQPLDRVAPDLAV